MSKSAVNVKAVSTNVELPKETEHPTKAGIPDWVGVKVSLKNNEVSAKSEEKEQEREEGEEEEEEEEEDYDDDYEEEDLESSEEEEEEKEEEKQMCYVCARYYSFNQCEGCEKDWKDKTRHPCRDYGGDFCPECDTDPAIFWS